MRGGLGEGGREVGGNKMKRVRENEKGRGRYDSAMS